MLFLINTYANLSLFFYIDNNSINLKIKLKVMDSK